MTYNVSTVLDFLAKTSDPQLWRMILVEEVPWEKDVIITELTRLQNRLYDCVDAALDGQLAKKFPETLKKTIRIELDGYNLPDPEVSEFFENFSQNIFEIEDYKLALKDNQFVLGIIFELTLQTL